jgi:hypothetical protein
VSDVKLASIVKKRFNIFLNDEGTAFPSLFSIQKRSNMSGLHHLNAFASIRVFSRFDNPHLIISFGLRCEFLEGETIVPFKTKGLR